MEKYSRAIKGAVDNTKHLTKLGMRAEGYSQLVGALNTIDYLAANDNSLSLEEYRELLQVISITRSEAIIRLVHEDENDQ